jgi:hypothetical protein
LSSFAGSYDKLAAILPKLPPAQAVGRIYTGHWTLLTLRVLEPLVHTLTNVLENGSDKGRGLFGELFSGFSHIFHHFRWEREEGCGTGRGLSNFTPTAAADVARAVVRGEGHKGHDCFCWGTEWAGGLGLGLGTEVACGRVPNSAHEFRAQICKAVH